MPRPRKKYLGDRFYTLRKKRNMTRYQLSKETGIPLISLTRIEDSTIRNPGIKTVVKLARTFGVSLDKLTEGLFEDDNDK